MKRFKLISSLLGLFLFLGGIPAHAAGEMSSFDFTLAYDYFTSLQNSAYKVGGEVYQAFEFDSNNATNYAGSRITSINITAGTYKDTETNTVKNVTVFLSEGLDKEPFYTQSGKLGEEGGTEYKISLDTPYTIESGKSIVVGYYFRLSSADINYISVDGVYHDNIDGGWVGYRVGSGAVEWSNISHNYGNICMGCTIEGDNLAKDGVSVLSLDGTEYAEPGSAFQYIMYFQNTATNDVTSMEVRYTVGDGEAVTQPVNLSEPMKYNERKGLRFSNLKTKKSGVDIPVIFEITKVNGNPNTSSDKSRMSLLNCFFRKDGFTRTHLLEEGTGTWCKWCPSGMVLIDYVKETFPGEYGIAAVHGNDQMQVASTAPVRSLFSGYPTIILDRAQFLYPQNQGAKETIKAYTEYYQDIPAVAGISTLEGYKDESGSLKLRTGVKFAVGMSGVERYRLSYYLTENGVGPYVQNNEEYHNMPAGTMGGWESKPIDVTMLFDDVACLLEGDLEGVAGSIPSTIEKGTEYIYETALPLSTVSKNEVDVIAFVIDRADGSVVNVRQETIDLSGAGVETVSSDIAYRIINEGGVLTVSGDFTAAEVYKISGEKAGVLKGEGSLILSPGIYVVNVDGKARKVLVK
ncbi:MAG: hypothetical protein K2N05_12675 [Muribaculaceae bacterium]|nr:hypothetical protein [Muribaculaceae bacterium]